MTAAEFRAARARCEARGRLADEGRDPVEGLPMDLADDLAVTLPEALAALEAALACAADWESVAHIRLAERDAALARALGLEAALRQGQANGWRHTPECLESTAGEDACVCPWAVALRSPSTVLAAHDAEVREAALREAVGVCRARAQLHIARVNGNIAGSGYDRTYCDAENALEREASACVVAVDALAAATPGGRTHGGTLTQAEATGAREEP